MNNFELIDDYLTGKLSEQDKKSFEQQLSSDPALQADLELQTEIILGLKAARAAELKTMLNHVVITKPAIYFTPLRIAAGLIGAAVIATSLYYYLDKNESFNTTQLSSSFADSIRQSEQNERETIKDSTITEDATEELPLKTDSPPKASTPAPAISPIQHENKPAIDILNPSEELTVEESTPPVTESRAAIVKIEINIISTERKFKSHYQFSNGKLVLYGDFDKDLYEIIEVNGQQTRSLFLNYKTAYYLLDESQKEITILKEITDPVLIQKLKSFQAK